MAWRADARYVLHDIMKYNTDNYCAGNPTAAARFSRSWRQRIALAFQATQQDQIAKRAAILRHALYCHR